MVNTPAEEGGAGCSHGRVKININWRSSFTRQLVNRVPHPIFCSVCVSCFIKFGRLRVSCVPPSPSPGGRPRGWCHPGPHWKPIRPPTAEQFHLQLSPFCRLEIGRSITPPRTHTKACVYPPSHWSALLVLKTYVIVILRVGFDHQHAEWWKYFYCNSMSALIIERRVASWFATLWPGFYKN